MLYVIIILLAIASVIFAFLYIRERNVVKAYDEKLTWLYQNIVLNNEMISQSISTVAEAYGIEEGDIKDWIAKKGKQNESKTRS